MLIKKSPRACTIIGNWKMHKTIDEARIFVTKFLADCSATHLKIGLAVPFTMIYPIAQLCQGTKLLIGAQTMNDVSEGAFTGEVAGRMLKDAGAQFVILGHSERRCLYHEDDASINRKLKRATEIGLQPLLCIGETKGEYDQGLTHQVIEKQLTEDLKDLQPHELEHLIIAYEPVWAIGNGHSATPEIAQEVHQFCRQVLTKILNAELADQIIIQYGGSVHPSNAHSLLSQPDIDGLLIGGASLYLESFLQIVNDNDLKIPQES